MTSKELLSKVLGYEVKEVLGMLENSANKTILSYIFKDTSLNEGKRIINIYELVHKCKEWVHNNYRLQVRTYGGSSCYFVEIYHIDTRIVEFSTHDTEPEAIFKACQWILENKNLKEENERKYL